MSIPVDADAKVLRQKGKEIINIWWLNVISIDDLDDAAQKIVQAVKG